MVINATPTTNNLFSSTKLIVYFFPNLFRLFHPHCAGFGPFGTSIAVLSQVIAASGWVRAARQPVRGSQTSIRCGMVV